MKKQLLSLGVLMLLASFIYAKTRTVNNNSPTPGQYSDLISAINASSNGDTILVQGSPYTYSSNGTSINKSVTIIGPGYFPSKQNTLKSIINTGTGGFATNVSNITIKGVILQGASLSISNVSNITISECYISEDIYIYNSNNVKIRNNIIAYNASDAIRISTNSLSYNYNLLIENNLFNASSMITLEGSGSFYQGVTFKNNTILGQSGTSNFINTSGKARYWAFYDNIFWNRRATAYCIDCSYINNVAYSTTNDPAAQITNTGLNVGNISDDPQFVNYPGGNYSSTYDFHLNTGSPAISTGSDGTDIGMYGGASPHTDHGMPDIPVMFSMDVLSGTVPAGGNIQVTFESHIQN